MTDGIPPRVTTDWVKEGDCKAKFLRKKTHQTVWRFRNETNIALTNGSNQTDRLKSMWVPVNTDFWKGQTMWVVVLPWGHVSKFVNGFSPMPCWALWTFIRSVQISPTSTSRWVVPNGSQRYNFLVAQSVASNQMEEPFQMPYKS